MSVELSAIVSVSRDLLVYEDNQGICHHPCEAD